MNAARGRLRNILHNGLFEHAANMLRHATCPCKEKTFFEYFKELESIKVWPLENTMKHRSIHDIIGNLRGFNASKVTAHLKKAGSKGTDSGDILETWDNICMCRMVDWKGIVSSTADTVKGYFHGLCLDCMSVTKALQEGRDPDHEYWLSGKRLKWDFNCRITHGEPTWYFSFMGRREKRGIIAY